MEVGVVVGVLGEVILLLFVGVEKVVQSCWWFQSVVSGSLVLWFQLRFECCPFSYLVGSNCFLLS